MLVSISGLHDLKLHAIHILARETYSLKFAFQVYIKGEFMGGAEIVEEMHRNGEIKPLLLRDD